MKISRSRITSQGQISIPAAVPRKLGVGPGSVIEWDDEGDEIKVKKAALYTIEDLHQKVFPEGPPPRKGLKQLDEGLKQYIRDKHARR